MSPTTQGFVVLVVTLGMLLSGIPVAFGLGAISIIFLLIFQGFDSMRIVAETFYAGLDDFTLVSIPMFVMMGAAIGSSPAAIILMTSPILLPIITTAGFDPVWFGVILTINMEIGLIHPPVGLNIYIVNAIAPDVPITKVMWGTLPYVLCMMLAIVILCIFPEIATWLPDHMMGAAVGGR